MSDRIRCPNCFGAKQVMKLGAMMGDCNTCNGKGSILESERPIAVVAPVIEPVKDIIKAVSEAIPVSTVDDKFTVEVLKPLPEEPAIKVDGKKALYKRKTVAK